jgi:transcriptional regulator with XRE-family HTH domain
MKTMIKSPHDKKYLELLDYLRSVRIERGLTVRQFAPLIGETYQIVSKIETGTRKLTVYEFVQYCDALGVNPKKVIEILM